MGWGWKHALCQPCWAAHCEAAGQHGRQPVRVRRDDNDCPVHCCSCGELCDYVAVDTESGIPAGGTWVIYVRAEPLSLPCASMVAGCGGAL